MVEQTSTGDLDQIREPDPRPRRAEEQLNQGLVLLGAWLELAAVLCVFMFWVLRGRGRS